MLKARMEQAVTQPALHDALSDLGQFIRKSPAFLRLSGNREFFSSYCGTSILRKLLPGNASERTIEGDEFSSLKSGVLNDLPKLMVPPLEVIERMEQEERQAIIEHLGSATPS